MHTDIFAKLRTRKPIYAIVLIVMTGVTTTNTAAALTADDVLNRMTAEQRHGYITGVVEGLAYSRYHRDRPDISGMQCIYDWYYEGGAARSALITQWLNRHLDRPVGALLHVLIAQDCGE